MDRPGLVNTIISVKIRVFVSLNFSYKSIHYLRSLLVLIAANKNSANQTAHIAKLASLVERLSSTSIL